MDIVWFAFKLVLPFENTGSTSPMSGICPCGEEDHECQGQNIHNGMMTGEVGEGLR